MRFSHCHHDVPAVRSITAKFIRALGIAFALSTAPLAAAAQSALPGTVVQDCSDCPAMVVVPPGRFVMGSNRDEQDRFGVAPDYAATELPAHPVRIDRSFAISRTPVTKDEWALYAVSAEAQDGPSGCSVFSTEGRSWGFDPNRSWRDPGFTQAGREPVVCVDFEDARRYAAWLSGRTRQRYRLPTEAEWEYAARAGTSTANYWGDTLDDACAHTNAADLTRLHASGQSELPGSALRCDDGYAYTAPVDAFPPNEFGLYGMSGNVNQIVVDCFHANYDGAPEDGRVWAGGDCRYHMDRGASWVNSPRFVRAAMRHKDLVEARISVLGFRLVRELAP